MSARRHGTAAYKLRTYLSPSVLVIDELGYLPLDQASANGIFQVVSRRYEKGSIILTSNRGLGDWNQVCADPVVAIVDRLLHNATVPNIRRASYRMRAYAAPAEAQGRRCYGWLSLETCALSVLISVHFPCSPTRWSKACATSASSATSCGQSSRPALTTWCICRNCWRK